MKKLREGELEFSFPADARVEHFDVPGRAWPRGIAPVDFILENDDGITLIEVKDPSATKAPESQRQDYVKRLQQAPLIQEDLVPKARGSYTFLHLMEREHANLRFVVVLGAEKLSLQPALLLSLTDRLRQRLAKEADKPWKRPYVAACSVVTTTEDLGKILPGCRVQRTTE